MNQETMFIILENLPTACKSQAVFVLYWQAAKLTKMVELTSNQTVKDDIYQEASRYTIRNKAIATGMLQNKVSKKSRLWSSRMPRTRANKNVDKTGTQLA